MPNHYPARYRYRYPAPAKLNLFLHIVGRRADGMHNLQTLFRLLDYGDSLEITLRDDSDIMAHCDIPELATSDNLVVRAAHALREACGITRGADIYIDKRIPLASGLGGASSDAATSLIVLNDLWGANLNQRQLLELGARLGADVPLFIQGFSAWGEGLGERLTPVKLEPAWYAVFTPEIKLHSAQQFADADLVRDSTPVSMRDYMRGATGNAFEPLARKHDEINRLFEAINGAGDRTARRKACLSGSGSSVFVEFGDETDMNSWLSTIDIKPTFVARGVNTSPLHDKLPIMHNN